MSSFGLHHLLLSDGVRLRAVRRALREAVRPGAVVVDLGAGTGILGFLSLRAGAARVYAVERHPILKLARAIAAENRFGDRVRFVAADSRRARLPERADLVVSELAGSLGIDPEMAEALSDARRFLKPGGRFMPQRSEVWVAPVRAAALHRRHVEAGKGHGVKLGAVRTIAANTVGCFPGAPRTLAAPLRRAFVFDFARGAASFPRRARLSFRVGGGEVHGLALVVRVKLSRSVTMESTFGAHWKPLFLPVERPIRTRRGERLEAEIVLHGASAVEWRLGDRRQSTLFERAAYA